MREGKKGERLDARRTPQGEHVFWSIFTYLKHIPGLFQLSSSLLLVFVFLVPRCPEMAVHPFRCVTFLHVGSVWHWYGTYRAHDKGIKFAGAEGAY
jgi:hypothetical protein